MTEDGQFGFRITKLAGQHMFQFQLVIDGHLVGDQEPCIIGSAMAALGELPNLDDQRLDLLSSDSAAVISVLESDAEIHDAATLSIAESLDGWWLRGYVHGGKVVMLARERRHGRSMGALLSSIVACDEYKSVYKVTRDYWLNARDSM
ncbi:hypothetical protein [Streptomyces sp. NPDC008139]|uniref:hypothetical protein n=1 Tax=Streptomyces sp. NPDC008139 TaxID=3364814 RepID=UPI0036E22238